MPLYHDHSIFALWVMAALILLLQNTKLHRLHPRCVNFSLNSAKLFIITQVSDYFCNITFVWIIELIVCIF